MEEKRSRPLWATPEMVADLRQWIRVLTPTPAEIDAVVRALDNLVIPEPREEER